MHTAIDLKKMARTNVWFLVDFHQGTVYDGVRDFDRCFCRWEGAMEEYRRQIIEAVKKIESIWLLEQILEFIKNMTR